MNDRFLNGFYAGVTGGVAMNLIAFVARSVLRVSEATYVDWTSLMIYGRQAKGFWQAAYALLVHLLWSGFLGVVFAYLMAAFTGKHLMFKAWFLAVVAWFAIDALTSLMNRSPFVQTGLGTSVAYLVGASAFGLVAGWVLGRLENPVPNS